MITHFLFIKKKRNSKLKKLKNVSETVDTQKKEKRKKEKKMSSSSKSNGSVGIVGSDDLERLKDVSPELYEVLVNVDSVLKENEKMLKDVKEKLEKQMKKKDEQEEEETDVVPQMMKVNENLNNLLSTFRDFSKVNVDKKSEK